jgi:hypothetical protein
VSAAGTAGTALCDSIEAGGERRRQAFLRKELEFVRAGVRAQRSKARTRLDEYDRVASIDAPEEELVMDLIIPPAPPLANTVIDATGKYVIPGGVDCHTHMELPFGGTFASDTFETGTTAAAWLFRNAAMRLPPRALGFASDAPTRTARRVSTSSFPPNPRPT